MELSRRLLLGGAATALAAPPLRRARSDAPTIRLGVLTDLSGPYRDTGGRGSVAGVEQAAAEAMAAFPGLQVEVLEGDHQNKPDIGAGMVRQWFDRDGVDAILDVPNSAVGLAVAEVAREKDRVFLATGASTTDLTGARCAATTVHWTFDTYMLARSTAGSLVAGGHDSWFFIVADYAFGHTLQQQASAVVRAGGGRVAGYVTYPFPGTSDFSAFMVQAKASGARTLGLCNAGADATNCIKQAQEFGLTAGGMGAMTLAALLMFIPDVHGLGLPAAQGLVLTETFYWDMNDRTRALTERVRKRMRPDWRPDMEQAGTYAAALHYLKAAADLGAATAKASGAATVARMKAMPTDDDAFGANRIREDGRLLHPAFLFQVKTPAESTAPWDYYKLLATVSPEDAARPLKDGGCKLIKA
jgi:branched-chain amino acid transport system substrate-binding protein